MSDPELELLKLKQEIEEVKEENKKLKELLMQWLKNSCWIEHVFEDTSFYKEKTQFIRDTEVIMERNKE